MSHSEEIRKMLRESGIEPQPDLKESEIACAVADALCALEFAGVTIGGNLGRGCPEAYSLRLALHRLEAATRGSALRKVKP